MLKFQTALLVGNSFQRASAAIDQSFTSDSSSCFEASQAIDRLSILLETLSKAKTLCNVSIADKFVGELQVAQLDLYPVFQICQVRAGEQVDRAGLKDLVREAAQKIQNIRL